MANIELLDLAAQRERIDTDIQARLSAVMTHGRYINGPEVGALETALAAFSGAAHCVSCGNGTDALQIALMAEDIGPGHAVFVPTFTFTATAESVLVLGATPIFCDVDSNTYNLDPTSLAEKVEEVLADGKLIPRAVIAVDLFGLPADYGVLSETCRRHNMVLIADAAQSFGAGIGDRNVGTLADVTTTSFFPAKPLGCFGDGGALITDDAARADLYRSIRAHGKGGEKYDIIRVGMNSRLDTIQAAILLAKLKIFPDEIAARRQLATAYSKRLKGIVETPSVPQGMESVWAQYSVTLDNRDEIAARLKEANIATAIYYPLPMHLQTAYRAFGQGAGSLTVSEELSRRILSLPVHPYLSMDEIEFVGTTIETETKAVAA